MPGPGKRFQRGNPGGPGRPRRRGRQYLRLLAEELTPEKWRSVVRKAIEQAEGGDPAARDWLSRRVFDEPDGLGLPPGKPRAPVQQKGAPEQASAGPGGEPGGVPSAPPPRPEGATAAAAAPAQPGGTPAASAGGGAGAGAGGQRPGAAGAATSPTGGTPAELVPWRGLFGKGPPRAQPPPAQPAPPAGPDGPRPGGAAVGPAGRP